MVESVNKTIAISTIMAVTMILAIGYLVPQIAATEVSSHGSPPPLYLEDQNACAQEKGKFCNVVIDINRSGTCDEGDKTIQMPKRVAETLPPCSLY